MSDISTLKALVDGTYFVRASEIRAAGIHPSAIAKAVEDYEIARLGPGIYASMETASIQHIDYAVLHMLTEGVIFGLTAAAVHKLSNASAPPAVQMMVPNTYTYKFKDMNVDLLRTRRAGALSEGVIDFEIAPGLSFKITNEARTVVDLYRLRGHDQHARDALADFLDRELSQSELLNMAEHFGVFTQVRAQTDMISSLRGRPMAPK